MINLKTISDNLMTMVRLKMSSIQWVEIVFYQSYVLNQMNLMTKHLKKIEVKNKCRLITGSDFYFQAQFVQDKVKSNRTLHRYLYKLKVDTVKYYE